MSQEVSLSLWASFCAKYIEARAHLFKELKSVNLQATVRAAAKAMDLRPNGCVHAAEMNLHFPPASSFAAQIGSLGAVSWAVRGMGCAHSSPLVLPPKCWAE